DPIQFTEHLDFGSSIDGLKLTAGGDVKFSIDPAFRLRIGLRLGPSVPIAERFYLAEGEPPEITVAVSVSLDDPNLTGTLGYLVKVKLEEDPTSTDNHGIHLNGTITVNLTDPGTGAANDNRVTIAEFTPGNLGNLFDASIDAVFGI